MLLDEARQVRLALTLGDRQGLMRHSTLLLAPVELDPATPRGNVGRAPRLGQKEAGDEPLQGFSFEKTHKCFGLGFRMELQKCHDRAEIRMREILHSDEREQVPPGLRRVEEVMDKGLVKGRNRLLRHGGGWGHRWPLHHCSQPTHLFLHERLAQDEAARHLQDGKPGLCRIGDFRQQGGDALGAEPETLRGM